MRIQGNKNNSNFNFHLIVYWKKYKIMKISNRILHNMNK